MNENDFIYEEYQISGCGLMVNNFVRKWQARRKQSKCFKK